MAKRIDEKTIEQIPILYEQLKNKAEVARQLGISAASVNKYLAIYNGAPIEITNKKRVKVDEELVQKINELYQSYRNMSQVAKELGISPSTVKNHLTEENFKLKDKVNDDRDALWYYIYRLFGPEDDDKPVSDWNITQMQKFNKQGMNYRAQLLTLKWFYEVKKNPIKEEHKTIGIIPFVYDQAAAYYKKQERKVKEIEEAIEKQLEQDRIEIQYNPSDYIGAKKKKKLIDLDSIVGDAE